jgi:hypothetical protein
MSGNDRELVRRRFRRQRSAYHVLRAICLSVVGTVAIAFIGLRPASSQTPDVCPVTLRWDSPGDPSIEEYEVRWGQASGVYTAQSPRLPETALSYSTTVPRGRWYFAARAVNGAGLLSAYSNEVSVDVQCGTTGDQRRPPQAIDGLVWVLVIEGE